MGRTNLSRADWSLSGDLRFSWSKAGNRKTGCPTSKTSAVTCPPGCPFLGSGCYAETNQSGTRVWREISTQDTGLSLSEFCDRIRALPAGTLWRHNEAGDLPGKGNRIDRSAFEAIVSANAHRRGFTYTHKPVLSGPHARQNRSLISTANAHGFTVNLSADGLADAARKVALGIAPVCVVLPADAPRSISYRGTRVTTCPAENSDKRCRDCGWCAKVSRTFVVGFRAHGVRHRMVSEIVA